MRTEALTLPHDRPKVLETNGNRSRRLDFALLAALTAVGAALRFYGLNGMGLWLDESNSVIIASEDFPGLIDRLRLDSSPAAYYVLLHLWMRVAGTGELAVKSLSAIFGTLLVPATYWLGREADSRRTGFGGAVLITFAPLAIYYAREARMYSLVPLLAALCFLAALRFLRRGSAWSLVGYIAACALCLHTHNYGFFVWAAAVVLAAVLGERAVSWRKWILVQIPIALLYAPWVPVLLAQIRNPTHYSWLAPMWRALPGWAAPYRSLESFMPGGAMPIYTDLGSLAWARTWPALAALVFLIPGVFGLPARGHSPGAKKWTGRALPILFLVPLVLPFVYSLFRPPVYVVARTDTVVYPVFLLLLASGAFRLGRRWVPVVGLALFLLPTVFTLAPYYETSRRTGDREIAMHAAGLTRPNDVIVCTGLTRASMEYYLRSWTAPRTLASFPAELARHMGNLDEAALLSDRDRLVREAEALGGFLTSALQEGRQCVILRAPVEVNRILWAHLEKRFDLTVADPPGGLHSAVTHAPVNVGRLTLPPERTGG